MDPFGDAFAAPANNSGDAGADFLTQQQNEMEALENQFGVTSEPADTTQQSGVPDFFAPAESAPAELTTPETNTKADSDIGADDDDEQPLPSAGPVPNSFIDSTSNEVSTPVISGPAYSAAEFRPEAASITAWKSEFQNRLSELDEKEAKLMTEWEEKAKKDLEEWRRRRQEGLEKQKQVNLENEQSFIEERESRSREGGGDIDWTRVSNLCDFNMKANKKSKDTTRMKSMFLQMKGDAVKAEGKINGF